MFKASSFAVFVLTLMAAHQCPAQPSLKVCSLLSKEDLLTAGIAVTARGLFADDPVTLKKGSLPGLSTDMRLEQCTSEMSGQFAAFPVRWSVATARDAMDRKAWKQMLEALDKGEEKDKNASPDDKSTRVGDADCENFSWLEKKNGPRIFAVNCGTTTARQQLTLEFAHRDKTKLPSVNKTKELLDKMLGRL